MCACTQPHCDLYTTNTTNTATLLLLLLLPLLLLLLLVWFAAFGSLGKFSNLFSALGDALCCFQFRLTITTTTTTTSNTSSFLSPSAIGRSVSVNVCLYTLTLAGVS